jgi:hypothetical protein
MALHFLELGFYPLHEDPHLTHCLLYGSEGFISATLLAVQAAEVLCIPARVRRERAHFLGFFMAYYMGQIMREGGV